jgi:hypothetical protein
MDVTTRRPGTRMVVAIATGTQPELQNNRPCCVDIVRLKIYTSSSVMTLLYYNPAALPKSAGALQASEEMGADRAWGTRTVLRRS